MQIGYALFVFVRLTMHIGYVVGYIVNVLKAPWMTHDEPPAAEFHSSLSPLMRNKAGVRVCVCLP